MVAEASQRLTVGSTPAGLLRRPATWLALPPAILLVGLGVVPLAIILIWSFWTWDPSTYWIVPDFSFAAYRAILSTGRIEVIGRTILLAAGTAALCTFLGFPAGYFIHFMARKRTALLLLALFTIPFFTSALIRAFAWRLVLGRQGVINDALLAAGAIGEPVEWLLFSSFAVVVGMVAAYLPFAIVPIMVSLARVEQSFLHASRDLGASFWSTLRHVVLPLAMPGVFAGFLFVFVVALGASTEIQLLGGAADSSITIMINDVMRVVNFPLAFAISTTVVVLLVLLLIAGNRLLGLARMFENFTW